MAWLLPTRWWLKGAALLGVLAQFIVLGALFRAFQHLIGFGDFFKFVFRVRFLADVWVVLTRQFAVSRFHRFVVCTWR